MSKEIEIKWLLDSSARDDIMTYCGTGTRIRQTYLYASENSEVRVRIKNDDSAFLTVKQGKGLVRYELPETPIDIEVAIELFNENKVNNYIDKVRYKFPIEDTVWEIDIFENGLILAEYEFKMGENSVRGWPLWMGKYWVRDVTDDENYKNKNLARKVVSYDAA